MRRPICWGLAGCAVFIFGLSGWANSANVGGYNTATEFMVAELKKQDAATVSDAVMGIWRERLDDEGEFCRIMQADTSAMALWIDGLRQILTSANGDTAMARLSVWRREVLDTINGPFAHMAACPELEARVRVTFRDTDVRQRAKPDSLAAADASRRGVFWFTIWKGEAGVLRRQASARLLELLVAYPNELYDVFSSSPTAFQRFVGRLPEDRFLVYDRIDTTALELARTRAIKRLTSDIVWDRFRGFNDMVVNRLKQTRVEIAP